MTHDEAAKLQPGDYVISARTFPPFKPVRVTEVRAVGVTGTRFAIRAHKLRAWEWFKPEFFEAAPKGAMWCALRARWCEPIDKADDKGRVHKVPGPVEIDLSHLKKSTLDEFFGPEVSPA